MVVQIAAAPRGGELHPGALPAALEVLVLGGGGRVASCGAEPVYAVLPVAVRHTNRSSETGDGTASVGLLNGQPAGPGSPGTPSTMPGSPPVE